MQVRLDSAVGQAPPLDTFVSLRIGDVQRQSRFALARTFHFPEIVDERHGRLEVFKRIGQATVSFDTDGDTQDVEACVPQCTILVQVFCELCKCVAKNSDSTGVRLSV